MFGALSRLIDPHVENYLLVGEGEQIVDEVRRHWMAVAFPVVRVIIAVILACVSIFVGPLAGALLMVAALIIALQAGWRILTAHMDRFVITTMRVFRVHGVFTQNRATMPMARILDITVEKPVIGRVFGYGHLVFESAAQDQGLRDIRWVGRPDERDATIQTVIQRSGLRASMQISKEEET
ncbi:PH domain-containing protein [Microlunatus parietis]|uniref:Membrane protein YdbS with pleckstrin-like domain n=1 Tax=Microlunatus parietis TaxID=682979 RepID=A0A7Y9IEF6_9ACTN|nr:PH domain-containing protein [Microlunatus parietis]NYE75431.1 membrane protein YdbS with pleckstrin-like domain [Microlunatus parietis]